MFLNVGWSRGNAQVHTIVNYLNMRTHQYVCVPLFIYVEISMLSCSQRALCSQLHFWYYAQASSRVIVAGGSCLRLLLLVVGRGCLWPDHRFITTFTSENGDDFYFGSSAVNSGTGICAIEPNVKSPAVCRHGCVAQDCSSVVQVRSKFA